MKARRDIRLLLAGVDVNLVNEDKVLTEETRSVTGGPSPSRKLQLSNYAGTIRSWRRTSRAHHGHAG